MTRFIILIWRIGIPHVPHLSEYNRNQSVRLRGPSGLPNALREFRLRTVPDAGMNEFHDSLGWCEIIRDSLIQRRICRGYSKETCLRATSHRRKVEGSQEEIITKTYELCGTAADVAAGDSIPTVLSFRPF